MLQDVDAAAEQLGLRHCESGYLAESEPSASAQSDSDPVTRGNRMRESEDLDRFQWRQDAGSDLGE